MSLDALIFVYSSCTKSFVILHHQKWNSFKTDCNLKYVLHIGRLSNTVRNIYSKIIWCLKIIYNSTYIQKRNNVDKFITLRQAHGAFMYGIKELPKYAITLQDQQMFQTKERSVANVVKASEWQCLLYMHYQTMNLDII